MQQGDFSCRKRPLGLVPHSEHTEDGLGHPKGHGENFLNLGTHPEGISYHRLSFGDGPARDPHARRYAMARLEGTTGTPGACDGEKRAVGLPQTEHGRLNPQERQDGFGDPARRRREVQALGQEACDPS